MKKVIIAGMCLMATSVFGQIKVNDQGRMGIDGANHLYGKLQINGAGADNCLTIYDESTKSGSTFRFFVDEQYKQAFITRGPEKTAGLTINNYGNVGVGWNYVSTTYRLTVNGKVCAQGSYSLSDKRTKKNIKEIKEQKNKLYNLKGVEYEAKSVVRAVDSLTGEKSLNFEENENETPTFGFVAQDLQEIYPELVMEDEDGLLAVNYVGIIPLLVEALKEQNTTIEAMESRLQAVEKGNNGNSKLKSSSFTTDTENVETVSEASLAQNNPNPFSEDTNIEMELPETIQSATLYIYNLSGEQILAQPVFERGAVSVAISGNDLDAGIYIYSLIADGELIGTRQMVLTK